MKDAGYAHMGVGSAKGKDKAENAARMAISSPLLETSIKGATGILINITASPDIQLEDIDLASTMVADEASPDANVIWGVAFDPNLDDEMKITIIATGFSRKPDDPYYKNQAAYEPIAPVQQPVVESAPATPVVEVEVVNEPESLVVEEIPEVVEEVKPVQTPKKTVDAGSIDFNNLWGAFKK